MNARQFAEKHGIRASSEWADNNPNMADDWEANHYKVTLRHKGRRMTIYYSMGIALEGEPEVGSVLDCLARDSWGTEEYGFEEWADDYGYERDSRKAERVYKTIEKQAARLKSFLGPALFRELLNTEPL